MTDVILHFTDEQREQIKILANQRGYDTIEAYVFSLIVIDAKKRLKEIAQSEQAVPKTKPQPEPPPDSFEANFRQALQNVMKKRPDSEDDWNDDDV